jgi:tRNA nucleotidyltransferase/poly(A) polymerase
VLQNLQSALARTPPLLCRLGQLPGIWLAGGWVRDACWGRISTDFDLAVEGPLQPVLDVLEQQTGHRPFRLNARFESYGLECEGLQIDIVPLHEAGVEADVARRDYTINSLLLPLSLLTGEALTSAALRDAMQFTPGALDDLAARVLRMNSRTSLEEDPLRTLRGYRLAAQHTLSVDPETRAAWRGLVDRVLEPAAERIHEELLKLFSVPCAEQVAMLGEDGLLWRLFPPLEQTVGCEQFGYHHLDVWEHTLLALRKLDEIRTVLPRELGEWSGQLASAWAVDISGAATAGTLTRIALLLHDVAKPPTRAVRPDGRASFFGHQDVGAMLMQPVLENLKFARDETGYVCRLIRQHMRLGYYSEPERLSPKLAYRYIRQLEDATPLMVLHTLADCAATGGPLADGAWERHLVASQLVLGHYYAQDNVASPPLLLDGTAIMALTGIPPGRRIGELKEALLEATAAGEVSTVAEAQAYVLASVHTAPGIDQSSC